MAKKNKVKNLFPQSGRTDLIDGILIGKQFRHYSDDKPAVMIRKLKTISELSSCPKLQERAVKTIELLSKYPENVPLEKGVRVQLSELVPDEVVVSGMIVC
ncbi:MAG: hypothetical protein ACD_80C00166G0014 [uncultured bacterium (gcode 4)]|uniref:Uncharacterized protein n=1 Tax=uncultured bacterium (gcode 4) TaxID=1234023 RepID=K1XWG6_9BACT|nr:MAG: hypothetical protein ACD_80C00166G0014 [uncultured bacterium (gcode 4)]HBB04325.1 hypothetical protein [Candidatus Gracilibacteria bacterium]